MDCMLRDIVPPFLSLSAVPLPLAPRNAQTVLLVGSAVAVGRLRTTFGVARDRF